eukprot:6914592-Pyramimonas_sp.AAC.1
MLDYIWGKQSNIENTLAFDVRPPVCALSPGIGSPPEWGMLARRSSSPPASRSCWWLYSMTFAANQRH